MSEEPTEPGQESDDTIVPASPPAGAEDGVAPRRSLPLEYSPQAAGLRTSRRGRFFLGFFGYIGFSILWFAAGGVLTHFLGIQLFAGWAVMTVLLLGMALFVRLRYRYSGLGYGILSALLAAFLIVAGLVLLLMAMCSGKL